MENFEKIPALRAEDGSSPTGAPFLTPGLLEQSAHPSGLTGIWAQFSKYAFSLGVKHVENEGGNMVKLEPIYQSASESLG